MYCLEFTCLVFSEPSGWKSQPTPNRAQSNSFELPRCEGGKACVAGLTAKELTQKSRKSQNLHDAAPVRPPGCYQINLTQTSQKTQTIRTLQYNQRDLDKNSQNTHTQACAAIRMGNASEVSWDSPKASYSFGELKFSPSQPTLSYRVGL